LAATRIQEGRGEHIEAGPSTGDAAGAKVFPGMVYQVGASVADRYLLEDVLGSGGVGIVYRALDRTLGVRVAIKVIRPKLIHTKDERKAFQEEIRRVKRLTHPNIVGVYEDGADDENLYVTMQLVEGVPLGRLIAMRRDSGLVFAPEEIEPLLSQLAAALDHAHADLVHGDLKPDNVIVQPELLKVTDFGLGRAIPVRPFLAVQKTRGNGPYLAPEVKRTEHSITGAADVFSAGVIVGELLTGARYQHDGAEVREAARKHGVPEGLIDVVAMAVDPEPRARYDTVGDLAEDFVAVAAGATAAMRRRPVATPAEVVGEGADGAGVPARGLAGEFAEVSEVAVAAAYPPDAAAHPPPPPETSDGAVAVPVTTHPTLDAREDTATDAATPRASRSGELSSAAIAAALPDEPAEFGHIADLLRDHSAGPRSIGDRDEDTPVGGLVLPDLSTSAPVVAPPPAPGGLLAGTLPPRRGAMALWMVAVVVVALVGIGGGVVLGLLRQGDGAPVEDGDRPAVAGSRGASAATADAPAATTSAASLGDAEAAPGAGSTTPAGGGASASLDLVPGGADTAAAGAQDTHQGGTTVPVVDSGRTPAGDVSSGSAGAGVVARPPEVTDTGEPPKHESASVSSTPAPADLPVATKPPADRGVAGSAADAGGGSSTAPTGGAAAKPPSPPSPPSPGTAPTRPDSGGAAATVASLSPAQPRAKCPPGMAYIAGGSFAMGSAATDAMRSFGERSLVETPVEGFCVDHYEYPNVSGQAPRVGVTWYQAADLCGRRSKRLCTEEEWERGCKGLGGYRFPYGNVFDGERCNTKEQVDSGGQVMPSGTFDRCRSGFGAYDMSGNADEWTASSWSAAIADRVVKGGSAQRPAWAARCASRANAGPNTKDPYRGLRCCAAPQE
jgi:formylglycine-generating enzyme required for sulfatase activity